MKTKIFLSASITFFLLAGCSKDDGGACGNGKEDFATFITPTHTFEVFNGFNLLVYGKIYYQYIGGATPRIQFFIAETIQNICPDEHMQVDYTIKLTNNPQPVAFTITAEALWDVFLGNESIILGSGILAPDFSRTSRLELGLKQVFQDLPAFVDVYNTVEFESQGSFAADSAYFRDHVLKLEIKSFFSKAL